MALEKSPSFMVNLACAATEIFNRKSAEVVFMDAKIREYRMQLAFLECVYVLLFVCFWCHCGARGVRVDKRGLAS